MSILITGIDMPTKGNPITVLIYPDGTAEWEAQNKAGTAVPIPPHGDLVDRDEMFAEFVVEGQKTTRYKVGERWELNGAEIRRVIQRLPAVIPVEESE